VAFILEKHLRVQGVGEIPIKLHRPITGKIKTVSVKREGHQWYACFSVECAPKPLPALENAVWARGCYPSCEMQIRSQVSGEIAEPAKQADLQT
jgi:hypothetical protein